MTVGVSEIRKGLIFLRNDDPHLVLSHDFHKMGRGGAINKTKVKNLKTGANISVTFSGNETVEVSEVDNQNLQFLYADSETGYFMNPDTYEQVEILLENIPNGSGYLKEGEIVQGVFFEEKIISVILPKKISFKVTSAADAVKGDSANNPSKEVTIETGATVNVPLFIKQGDIIHVNTDTNEYSGKDNG